jgi:hypothetical protein
MSTKRTTKCRLPCDQVHPQYGVFHPGGHELPQPDWADVREAARKAGYRISRTAKRRRNDRRMWLWYALDGDDPVGEFHKTSTGVQVHLRGPKGYTALLEFSAAEVLTAARLVGLGGDSDA